MLSLIPYSDVLCISDVKIIFLFIKLGKGVGSFCSFFEKQSENLKSCRTTKGGRNIFNQYEKCLKHWIGNSDFFLNVFHNKISLKFSKQKDYNMVRILFYHRDRNFRLGKKVKWDRNMLEKKVFCIQKQGLNKGPDHYSLIYRLYKLILDVCHSFFLPILSQQEMEDVGLDLPR